MRNIKLNSEYNVVFLMVSNVNHIIGQEGASPVCRISKAGSPFSICEGLITELGYGWYSIALSEDDTNIPGELVIHVDALGCDPTDVVYNIGAEGISSAIRNELSAEMDIISNSVNGLTPQQYTMLLEIYRLMGLDPTKPLIVTKNSRQAGTSISQNISSDQFQTIVTRT